MVGLDPLTETTRLFVGGLPHDITPEQIAQRFQSFGSVQSVELVPEKEGSVHAGPTLKQCRGFAFVQLRPKDDAVLHRCMSMVRLAHLFPSMSKEAAVHNMAHMGRRGMHARIAIKCGPLHVSLVHCFCSHLQYNGCKWMGGVLRVEPASMHYRARLAKEEVDELSDKQPLGQDQAHASSQPGDDVSHEHNRDDAAPLTILRRDGKKVVTILCTTSRTKYCLLRIFTTGCSCRRCLVMADKLMLFPKAKPV